MTMTMTSEWRVRVYRTEDGLWRAVLVDAAGLRPGTSVGVFDRHREAVTRGCTALRFVAAGIPWRADA
jgi:hypothetical protein